MKVSTVILVLVLLGTLVPLISFIPHQEANAQTSNSVKVVQTSNTVVQSNSTTQYIYKTSVGTYSFNKAYPFILNYTGILANVNVPFSTFGVNQSNTILIPCLSSSLCTLQAHVKPYVYSAVYDVINGVTKVGTLNVTYNFQRSIPPKITVTFTTSATNYNIFWLAAGYKVNNTLTSSTTKTTIGIGHKATLLTSSTDNLGVILNWGDYGNAKVIAWQSSFFGLATYSATLIAFGNNVNKIDPTVVQSNSGTCSNCSSLSVSFSSAITSGDLLIVGFQTNVWSGGQANFLLSDTLSNNWKMRCVGNQFTPCLAFAQAKSSGTDTVTVSFSPSFSGTFYGLEIMEVSGVSLSNVFSSAAWGSPPSTSLSAPSLPFTATNYIVVASIFGGAPVSAGTGYTYLGPSNSWGMMEYSTTASSPANCPYTMGGLYNSGVLCYVFGVTSQNAPMLLDSASFGICTSSCSGTTISLSFTQQVSAGNVIVVAETYSASSGSNPPAPTDTLGTTFQQAVCLGVTYTPSCIYYGQATSSGVDTISATGISSINIFLLSGGSLYTTTSNYCSGSSCGTTASVPSTSFPSNSFALAYLTYGTTNTPDGTVVGSSFVAHSGYYRDVAFYGTSSLTSPSTFPITFNSNNNAGWTELVAIFIPQVTQPINIPTPAGGSAFTYTVSGCSVSPTSGTSGTTANFQANPSCTLTISMPAAGTNTRYVFGGSATSTTVTTCSSGTCATFQPADYYQVYNTYSANPVNHAWDSAYTISVSGTQAGASATLCSITTTSGSSSSASCSAWSDYNTGASLSNNFNSVANTRWLASSTSFTPTTGGNTFTVNYYYQLYNTFSANPSSPTTFTASITFTASGTSLGASATICTISVPASPAAGAYSCAGWSDYNTGVSLPANPSGMATNTRWQASGTNSFTPTTGGNTYTANYYEQVYNTFTFTATSPSSWDSTFSSPVVGTYLGTANSNICVASLTSGQASGSCSGWSDYNTLVQFPSISDGTGKAWNPKSPSSFTPTTGGNTLSVSYYLQYLNLVFQASPTQPFDSSYTITVSGTQFGSPATVCTITASSCSGTVDAGTSVSVTKYLSSKPSVRYVASPSTFTPSAGSTTTITYYKQYLLTNPSSLKLTFTYLGNANTTVTNSWFDASTGVNIAGTLFPTQTSPIFAYSPCLGFILVTNTSVSSLACSGNYITYQASKVLNQLYVPLPYQILSWTDNGTNLLPKASQQSASNGAIWTLAGSSSWQVYFSSGSGSGGNPGGTTVVTTTVSQSSSSSSQQQNQPPSVAPPNFSNENINLLLYLVALLVVVVYAVGYVEKNSDPINKMKKRFKKWI